MRAGLVALAMLACCRAAGAFELAFDIGTLALPGGPRFEGIEFRCPDLRLGATGAGCEAGTLRVADSPLGPLRIPVRARPSAAGQVLEAGEFRFAGGRLQLSLEGGAAGWRLRSRLDAATLPRLIAAARAAFPALAMPAGLAIGGGRASFALDCTFGAEGLGDCDATGTLSGVDADGSSSAEDATLRFEVTARRAADRSRWRAGFALVAGTLYVEPGVSIGGLTPGVLLQAGPSPIEAALEVDRHAGGRFVLRRLDLRHPGVASLALEGAVDLAPAVAIRELTASLDSPALAALYVTWLQPLVLGTALGDLDVRGGLAMAFASRGGYLERLDFDCHACSVVDALGRFGVEGLEGGFRLHAGQTPRRSALGWAAASIYRLPLGAGRIEWSSSGGALTAVDWLDVPILDGLLRLDAIEIVDPLGPSARLVLAGRLEPVTLAALTARYGWPPLAGRIAGTLPRLGFSRGLVTVDGDIGIEVFGGEVRVQDLAVEELFGPVPRLRANVSARGLDLSQLTATFSFGSIEGHLDGEIRDLELEAWQPVGFDAWFATPPDDDLPHRISRQAVSNLGRLGAGTSGPLASGWLGLIPSYSYGDLGLGCRLINGICHLRGLEELPDGGFRMLTPGGWLPPWIDIRGAGRQVAWQTLVEGMRRIGEGEMEFDVGFDVDGGRGSAP